jgi:two-component system OmpR family sensor kinase
VKRVLFWKIFLGFGVTFIFIIDGLWLLFNVLHPVPSETTRALAKISTGAAVAMIERGGEPELRTMLQDWPLDERGTLTVEPWQDHSQAETNLNTGAVTREARDPQGRRYEVTYTVRRHLGYGRGPFDIPPEIMMLAMLGGLIFSGVLAWHLTDPIRRISKGFHRLASADFSARLGPTMRFRHDELAELTREFDKLAERLQELVASREKLIADVSHELLTPLTRLQLAIELAGQDPGKIDVSLKRIRHEAQNLDSLVGELLTLSRLESGTASCGEYFDVAEITRGVVEDARFEAASRDVEIAWQMTPQQGAQDWIVAGNGKLVHRAVENVVRNAIRFSRRGQQVAITLDGGEDGQFHLSVLDSGPGVAEECLPFFFDPFAKRRPSDSHSVGLGLSIARRAIVASNGSITVRNRAIGGLAIAITLPAVVAQPEADELETA